MSAVPSKPAGINVPRLVAAGLILAGALTMLASLAMPTTVWINGLGETQSQALQHRQLVVLVVGSVLAVCGYLSRR